MVAILLASRNPHHLRQRLGGIQGYIVLVSIIWGEKEGGIWGQEYPLYKVLDIRMQNCTILVFLAHFIVLKV